VDFKPYWSDELGELQNKLSQAWEEAESNPSQKANLTLQQAKAKFLRYKLETQGKSWKSKTASLNLERDGHKLWRLTKQLNLDKDQLRGPVTLEEEGEMLTGRQAANVFAHNYKDVSDIPVNNEGLGERNEKGKQIGKHHTI
jgi:hypothetical protein